MSKNKLRIRRILNEQFDPLKPNVYDYKNGSYKFFNNKTLKQIILAHLKSELTNEAYLTQDEFFKLINYYRNPQNNLKKSIFTKKYVKYSIKQIQNKHKYRNKKVRGKKRMYKNLEIKRLFAAKENFNKNTER